MHISKFDLYRPEWLELVFDDRNKEYGAYDLRKHYSDNLVKAMGIAFFGIAAIGGSIALLSSHHSAPAPIIDDPHTVIVNIDPRIIHPKPTEAPKSSTPTVKNPPMVAVVDNQAQKPVIIDEFKDKDPGAENSKGRDDGKIEIPEASPGDGVKSQPTPSNNAVLSTSDIDVMPEPCGGGEAWLKFLQKNIRYPNQAIDANVQGKVWLSFIIERDGHLSNITVERGVGSGLDDEALRVLKLALPGNPESRTANR